jgi:hypothetical protein
VSVVNPARRSRFLREFPYEFIAIILLANFAIGVAGQSVARTFEARARADRSRELEAIADLKAQGITTWMDGRLTRAEYLTAATDGKLVREALSPGGEAARVSLGTVFSEVIRLSGYRRVTLFRPDWHPLLSVPDPAPPSAPSSPSWRFRGSLPAAPSSPTFSEARGARSRSSRSPP